MAGRSKHIVHVLAMPKYGMLAAIITLFFVIVFALTSEYELIHGNLGGSYLFLTLSLQLVISVLIGVNIGLFVHRLHKAKKVSKRSSVMTGIGSVLALLISGCGACGLSLAATLGLGGAIVLLPFHGIELKILALLLLVLSLYVLSNPNPSCKLAKK